MQGCHDKSAFQIYNAVVLAVFQDETHILCDLIFELVLDGVASRDRRHVSFNEVVLNIWSVVRSIHII